HPKPDAGEAQAGENRAQATPAPTSPRAGALAGKRGAGSSRLLRRARQHRRCWDLPSPGGSLLAACTSLPEPAAPPDLAEDESPHRPVAAACPHRASPTQRALRRQDPRQEPDAVVPPVGICPGGRPQGRSLPGYRAIADGEPGTVVLDFAHVDY